MATPTQRTIDLSLMKERMTFIKYSAETNGAYTEFSSTIAPGHANPEHYMPNTRAILTGRAGVVTGTVDGRPFQLNPDNTLIVKRGQKYSVTNKSADEDAQMTVRMEPGMERFEQAMYCMYGLAKDGKTGPDGMPSNLVQLAVVVGLMDVILTGWSFWLARPLLAAARAYGRAAGVETTLLKKYWSI